MGPRNLVKDSMTVLRDLSLNHLRVPRRKEQLVSSKALGKALAVLSSSLVQVSDSCLLFVDVTNSNLYQAIWAIPGYTFMGIHKEVRKLFGTSVLNYCISARTAQGFEDAKNATPEERLDVIYRWTSHKAEYQNMRQKLLEGGGPEGQNTGHLSPRGFLQTRHLSFEERKNLHEERRVKREEDRKTSRAEGGHKHCPFCRRANPHSHTPREVQDMPHLVDDPSADREAEFEHAIHASVAATSHGNAEEDLMIERAIRASVKELQSNKTLTDQEALERAIQASVVESGHRKGSGEGSSSLDFTEEDAAHQSLLEKAIQDSLMSYSIPASQQPEVDVDTDDDEDVKLAMQKSKEEHNAPKAADIDDALNHAIQQSKEDAIKAKAEEEIVLEYVKKQSMQETEHKSVSAGKQKEVVEEEPQSKADEEALKQAIEMSLKHAGGDGDSGSG